MEEDRCESRTQQAEERRPLLSPPEPNPCLVNVSAKEISAPSRPVVDFISASRRRYSICCRWIREVYLHIGKHTEDIRNDGSFSILLFYLFLLPVSAIYMGLTYVHKCPASARLPYLVSALGIFGCLILLVLLANLVLKLRGRFYHEVCVMALAAFITLLASLLLMVEMIIFFKLSPDFVKSSENYCSKTFYHYVYYSNFVTIGVSILMTFFYLPCSLFGYRRT
ncbi:hypothetical protein NPIL_65161 [Nephila pilipes]|uniref:Uncharacterized protein n=1 Tax=Nephila pilipes TaxID=299642 RepID=A0A8X6J064_NEPPI|nr:hypothetical protein NPIL_65161 [Nephila pilipes]